MYDAFGLSINSSFPFPELASSSHGTPAQVEVIEDLAPIRLGRILSETCSHQANPESVLLSQIGVGRFLVTAGRTIVCSAPDCDDFQAVRASILTSPIAALFLQRGWIPLHAASIYTDKGPIVLAGQTGAGKSTLAAWFLREGSRVMNDDITPIRYKGGSEFEAFWGYPQIALRSDMLNHLGMDTKAYRPIRKGSAKLAVPCTNGFGSGGVVIRKLFLIEAQRSCGIRVERVPPLLAKSYLFDFTFQNDLTRTMWIENRYRKLLSKLSESVEVIKIYAPEDKAQLDRLGRFILSKA